MKPSDINRVVSAGSPAVSPDGARVAFVVRRTDADANGYRSQIWIAATDGLSAARPLTAGEKGDSGPEWSPSGDRLAFVSHRTDKPGGTTLHVMAMDGPGETHTIATMKDSAGGLRWSPDGRWIAFSARTPHERYKETDNAKQPPRKIEHFFTQLNGEGWVYDRPEHIYIVASDGSSSPENLTDGPHSFSSPVWTSDSTEIIARGSAHDGWDRDLSSDLYRIRLDATRECLTDHDGDYTPHDVRGTSLAFAGTDDPRAYPQNDKVGVLDLTTNERRWVSESLDRPFSTTNSGQLVRWLDDDTLLSLMEDRGDASIVRISLSAGSATSITAAESVVTGFSVGTATLAYSSTVPSRPSEITAADANGANERRLTFVTDRFVACVGIAPVERFTAPSTDGVDVDAWIVLPPNLDPSRTYPVLLNVHGGPFTQYGNGFFDEAQVQATAGYVVVMGNPRGSSGRENAWCQAIMGPKHPTHPGRGWGSVDVEDVLAILDEALRRYSFCDPERVGMLGGSYGGYMATMLAARHGSRFKAICSERSVNNLLSEEWSSDIATMFRVEHGPNHIDDPDEYSRMSPIRWVRDIHVPMLLIHSENDLRCPIVQAEELFVALRTLGREVEFYRFPDETHELSRSGSPIHREQRFDLILDFFGRHLQQAE